MCWRAGSSEGHLSWARDYVNLPVFRGWLVGIIELVLYSVRFALRRQRLAAIGEPSVVYPRNINMVTVFPFVVSLCHCINDL